MMRHLKAGLYVLYIVNNVKMKSKWDLVKICLVKSKSLSFVLVIKEEADRK